MHGGSVACVALSELPRDLCRFGAKHRKMPQAKYQEDGGMEAAMLPCCRRTGSRICEQTSGSPEARTERYPSPSSRIWSRRHIRNELRSTYELPVKRTPDAVSIDGRVKAVPTRG